MPELPQDDLESVLQGLKDQWTQFADADILVTGGTGFFGVWLVSALLHANERLGLNLRVHVMSRRPEQFVERVPQFAAASALNLVSGDIRTYRPAPGQRITHIIHAATAASAALNAGHPAEMANVAAEGTYRLLTVARELGVKRMLFTSSGAVYGKAPPGVIHVREDQMFPVDPLDINNAYTEGKRLAELYCSAYCAKQALPVVIARCFAFVGPYLPLDTHFAIGNFIRNALRKESIIVASDGTPRRSYLYATDLTIWLLYLLCQGTPGRAYNVGSNHDLSVGELATLVGALANVPVEVRGTRNPDRPVESYVPSTERIQRELGVSQTVTLEQGIRRTMQWYANDAVSLT